MLSALTGFFAQHSAIIGLGLLIATLAMFIVERRPPVVIAIAGAILMLVFGYVSPDEFLGVFSNTAPVTIAAMFVLSGALLRTGALEEISARIIRRSEGKPRLAIAELTLGGLTASAFMNNTPVVIVLIPVVRRLAAALNIAATRLVMPVSYIAILGGTLTLIGTSTNLLVDGVARASGQPGFGIFEITAVGAVAATAGLLTLFILGPVLLPNRMPRKLDENRESDVYLTQVRLGETSDPVGKTVAQSAMFRRPGVKLLGLRRGSAIQRADLKDIVLQKGDELVIAASPEEIASLAEAPNHSIGLVGLGGGVATSGPDRPEDLRIVEAVVSTSHPVVGRRLADIAMLSHLKIRMLGLSRPRHVAGPDLANVRVRAGDRLMIAAGEDAARALQGNVQLVNVGEAEARAFRRSKAPFALVVLAGVVVGAAVFSLPIHTLAIVGVALVLLAQCLEPEEAWRSIDGNTLCLIFAMLAFGKGLDNAGTVQLLVDTLSPFLQSASPLGLIFAVYIVSSLLTESVTNNAVAVIMTPLAIGLAEHVGVDPRALIVAVMFGASASFATPIGYQTNTLVYGAANYRFMDFVRIGVPMNIIVGIASCLAISAFF